MIVMASTTTTVRSAREASKEVGSKIHWRPDGLIDPHFPDADPAVIMELPSGK